MNDDSIATHMYCHMLSVLLTGQQKKRKKKKKKKKKKRKKSSYHNLTLLTHLGAKIFQIKILSVMNSKFQFI